MGVGGTGLNPGVQFPGDKLRFKLPTHVHVAMVAMLKRHYANPQGDLGAQGKQFKDKNESVVFGELFGAARNKVAAEQKQDGFDYETFTLEDLRKMHERGELTLDEFEHARNKMFNRVRGTDAQAPGAGVSRVSGRVPPPRSNQGDTEPKQGE